MRQGKKMWDLDQQVGILGNSLRRRREELGLGVDVVAIRVGISSARYEPIESGADDVTVRTLAVIGRVLEAPLSDLTVELR